MAMRSLALIASLFAPAVLGDMTVVNSCNSVTGTTGMTSFDRDDAISAMQGQLSVHGQLLNYVAVTPSSNKVYDLVLRFRPETSDNNDWNYPCSSAASQPDWETMIGYFQNAIDNCDTSTTTEKWGNNMLIDFGGGSCYSVKISADGT